MKTIAEITKTLEAFEKKFGMPVVGAQQKSEAWFKLKLGVISASNASKVVAKADSETRATYMAALVGQVCTGIMEEISSKEMDWGNQHEDAARSSYEFSSGLIVTELPFVFKDDSFREGCSPDGFVGENKCVEIKCPYKTENYIKFAATDKIKPDYQWQVQFSMRVLDAGEYDFVQYDPRMRKEQLTILTVARDVEKQKKLADSVPQFISDMDDILKKIGVPFGSQWSL